MFVLRRNFQIFNHVRHQFSTCICPPPPTYPVVTVLDVSYAVGANLALLLKQNPMITELRVYDENKDCFCLAEDLNHIDTKVRVLPFSPSSLKDALSGAHIVISTGGCQSKVKQSQTQLLEQNLDNVRNVALFLSEFNPAAIFCIAKPPTEALVPLVSEEYKKADTYDPRKIIGVTTSASMVANSFIAMHLKVDPASILCPLVGGVSAQTLVPVISQVKRAVEYNTQVYKKLQEHISAAEDEVLQKGSLWCFSKAVGIARFVNLLLKAIKGARDCVECAFVAQTGHIGEFLPYMTSIVKLGPEGVTSTHMPRINEFEIIRLKTVLPQILDNIALGLNFLRGDSATCRNKRQPNKLLKKKLDELQLRGVCRNE